MTCCAKAGFASAEAKIAAASIPYLVMGSTPLWGDASQACICLIVPRQARAPRQTSVMPCADRRETLQFRLCDLHTGVKFRPPPVDQPREIQGNARRRATSITVISYGNTLHGFTNPAADGSMMRAASATSRPTAAPGRR
jgi:hypothetical protein